MSVVEFRHDSEQIILPVAILHPDPFSTEMVRANALVDTGASLCGLDRQIIERLRLPRAGKVNVQTPAGLHIAKSYRFRLGLYVDPHATMPLVMDHQYVAIENHPGERFETLLGMNVLGAGELLIASDGTGSFSFA